MNVIINDPPDCNGRGREALDGIIRKGHYLKSLLNLPFINLYIDTVVPEGNKPSFWTYWPFGTVGIVFLRRMQLYKRHIDIIIIII